MAMLRIYNRYAFAEIFGGLVGWPLAMVGLYAVWFFDFIPDNVDARGRWLLWLGLFTAPCWVIYQFYKAIVHATKCVDFGKRVYVHRLLRKGTIEWEHVDKVFFDNEPVGMSSGISEIEIVVTHEKFLRLVDRQGRQITRLRIDKVDRANLLELLRKRAPETTVDNGR